MNILNNINVLYDIKKLFIPIVLQSHIVIQFASIENQCKYHVIVMKYLMDQNKFKLVLLEFKVDLEINILSETFKNMQ